MEIATLTDKKLWLAPLAGFTDNAFRTIAKRCGAEVIVSEMVSADGLFYNPERSLKNAMFEEKQRPFGVQLFGSEPEMMAKGAEIISRLQPDFIDLNMGCPVKKVVNRMAGSALMKDIDLACRITEAVKEVAQKHNILVTTKFRSGWDLQSINYLSFGKALENSGSDALILHPRTKTEMFGGHSNWQHIKELKQNSSLPVIGNGDIKSVTDALEMYEFTQCDSIMIGRGVLGQPWLFQEIKDGLTKPISDFEKKEIIREHYRLVLENIKPEDEIHALRGMRAHFNHYSKGSRDGAQLRNAINQTDDLEVIFDLIHQINYIYE